jgi:hypothetical protein
MESCSAVAHVAFMAPRHEYTLRRVFVFHLSTGTAYNNLLYKFQVRSNIHPSRVLIEANIFDAGEDLANATRIIELAPDASHSPADGTFVIWSTQTVGDVPASSFGIVAEVGGNRIELPYTEIGLIPCA